MTLYVKDAGTWKTVTAAYVNDAGTWKTATLYVKDAGTWKAANVSLVVSGTNPVNGSASGFAPSGNVSVVAPARSVTGNTGTVSYSWARQGPAATPPISIANSTTNAPTFSANSVPDGTIDETWRCTATDAGSGSSAYQDVAVILRWTDNT